MTLEQIAQIFVDEGTTENVRRHRVPQAYIETGGFSAGGSENNFSGLGGATAAVVRTTSPALKVSGPRSSC